MSNATSPEVDEKSLSLELPWTARRPRLRGRSTRLTTALTISLVVVSLAAAALWLVNGRQSAIESGRSKAVAAAKKNVAELLSYDYRTISTAVEQRAGLVTGSFESEYADLVRDQVAPAAKARKVVTRTDVVTSSVISAKAEVVQLLLFLNQVSATKDSKVPVLSGSRVRVHMQKVGGTWRVEDVTPL